MTDLAATYTLPGDIWLSDNSWTHPTWTVADLVAAKHGRTISVVLPALNEEETVGSVVETISPLLGGLVDELVVLDSGSTDDTEIRAVAASVPSRRSVSSTPKVSPTKSLLLSAIRTGHPVLTRSFTCRNKARP